MRAHGGYGGPGLGGGAHSRRVSKEKNLDQGLCGSAVPEWKVDRGDPLTMDTVKGLDLLAVAPAEKQLMSKIMNRTRPSSSPTWWRATPRYVGVSGGTGADILQQE